MEDFANIISTLGFPVAVACYALWSSHQHEKYLQSVLDGTLKENTAAVNRLSDLIERGLLFMKGVNKGEDQ